jgi:hypothetical protein
LLFQAHLALGWSLAFLDLASARAHLEKAVALYDPSGAPRGSVPGGGREARRPPLACSHALEARVSRAGPDAGARGNGLGRRAGFSTCSGGRP